MNINVGDQIKTVYGFRFVTKVNAKSVRVRLSEGEINIANSQVAIMNPEA